MDNGKMKQSLLMGALTSSFGIFVSKLLGLLYYSPLSSIAGEENMTFYSIVYTYYDLLLQVSSAGIPFAIAALVSKYMAKKDYRTVLLVKKLGTSIVMALSVFVGLIFILLASPLSYQSLGASAPAEDIENLRLLFYILTIAVIVVPFLSSIRAYCQGLKRLDIYASSQVLEQFVRVFSIIIFSWLFVKILKMHNIWAIYVAVAAASLGAIVALSFTKFMGHKDEQRVEDLAAIAEGDCLYTKKEIIIEILTIGIPYLIFSFLGSAGPLVNTTFFMDYMTKINGPGIYESAKLSSGILQANCAKLANIPSVLALGFGSGMVPYLSEALEDSDNHLITRYINQILDTCTFILVPMMIIFIFFAKDIYFIMYGSTNLELGSRLFAVSNIQTFLGTIAPVFSTIMMSLKLRREAIVTLIISFIAKLVTFFPLVRLYGTYGMIYSSGIYYLLQILIYFYFLRINFGTDVKGASKRLILITLCSLIMVVPAYVLNMIVPFAYNSRLMDIVRMGMLGIFMLAIYYMASILFGLIQKIFEIKEPSIKALIRKFRS